jgi:hypothetical protein
MVAGMDEDAVRIVPIEGGVPVVAVEDVHDSSGRPRPPWWVVVVMVLSTIGLVWMFSQGPESEPEPEPVEFRTVYSVPGWEHSFESIKEFLPQPWSALGYTWSLVALLDGEFSAIGADSSMEMVIGGGPGFVAVGSSGSSAAVWSSVDGAGWSRALGVDDASGTGYERWMSAVAVGGPGLVAVGGETSTGRNPPYREDDAATWTYDGDAAVWTSVDGSMWARVPHDEDIFGSARLWTVVAGGPGVVAVGDDVQHDAFGVWVSNDGLSWSRVPVDESVFAGATVENVVAGGPGLVAVGHTGPGLDREYLDWKSIDKDSDAVVWVSSDGTAWSRVPHDESVFGGDGLVAMYDVTVGGPGLVAVGGGSQGAVVWTSGDGLVWVRQPHNESIFGPSWEEGEGEQGEPGSNFTVMVSVAAGEQDLVAVGYGDDPMWASNDGVTWRRFTGGSSLFDGGDRLTAKSPGYFLFGGSEVSEVWTAVPDEQ